MSIITSKENQVNYEFGNESEEAVWKHLQTLDTMSLLRNLSSITLGEEIPRLGAVVTALSLAVGSAEIVAASGRGPELVDGKYRYAASLLTDAGIYSVEEKSLEDPSVMVSVTWTPWNRVTDATLSTNSNSLAGPLFPIVTWVSFTLPDETRLLIGGRHGYGEELPALQKVYRLIQSHTER